MSRPIYGRPQVLFYYNTAKARTGFMIRLLVLAPIIQAGWLLKSFNN